MIGKASLLIAGAALVYAGGKLVEEGFEGNK